MGPETLLFAALVAIGSALLASAALLLVAVRAERAAAEVRHASYRIALAAPDVTLRLAAARRTLEKTDAAVAGVLRRLDPFDRAVDRTAAALAGARSSIWGAGLAIADAVRWVRRLQAVREAVRTVRFMS